MEKHVETNKLSQLEETIVAVATKWLVEVKVAKDWESRKRALYKTSTLTDLACLQDAGLSAAAEERLAGINEEVMDFYRLSLMRKENSDRQEKNSRLLMVGGSVLIVMALSFSALIL